MILVPPMAADVPARYILLDRGMVYFRRRGCRKIRIREPLGTPEFHRRYAELLAQSEAGDLKLEPANAPKPGTWRWLCTQYFASETGLLTLDDQASQRVRRLILESTFDETIAPDSPLLFSDCPLPHFTPKAVSVLRDRKKQFPQAANNRIKAISAVFVWALKPENSVSGVTSNPTRDVSRLRPNRQGGHHTWTSEEIEQFEKRHPLGTKPHLALTLLIYSGGRRGDVVRIGRQHTRGGWLRYTQEKNRRRNPVTIDIAMPIELQRVVDASPCGGMTFLVTQSGRPFAKAGFGNWFRDRCNEAGLHRCTAHGLRKAAALRVAENRGTVDQLKAIFGWRSNRMAELYVQAADRKRLGSDAAKLLKRPKE